MGIGDAKNLAGARTSSLSQATAAVPLHVGQRLHAALFHGGARLHSAWSGIRWHPPAAAQDDVSVGFLCAIGETVKSWVGSSFEDSRRFRGSTEAVQSHWPNHKTEPLRAQVPDLTEGERPQPRVTKPCSLNRSPRPRAASRGDLVLAAPRLPWSCSWQLASGPRQNLRGGASVGVGVSVPFCVAVQELFSYNRENFKFDQDQRIEREARESLGFSAAVFPLRFAQALRLEMQVKRFELFREARNTAAPQRRLLTSLCLPGRT